MPCARKIAINRSSVALFPLPRMRAMTALRFSGVKTSGGIGSFAVLGGDFCAAFVFLWKGRVEPVVDPGMCRGARIHFLIEKLACIVAPPCFGSEAFQHARPAAALLFKTVWMRV